MKRFIFLIAFCFSWAAYAVPLETFTSFTTDHPYEARKAPSCQLVARGSGTDTMYFVEVDPTTGQLPVSAVIDLGDTDWGAVGADTQRVAAVIGNETAVADFGSGVRGAQTLRVTRATDDTQTVTATDLDIRDLASGTDSVTAVQSGTWTVSATSFDIRALDGGTDSVNLSDGSDALDITAAGEITVVANDLSIRAISASSDHIAIGDNTATDFMEVNADGSINTLSTVSATDLDIRDLSSASDSIAAVQSGAWSVSASNLPATVDTNSGAAGANTPRAVLATRHEAAATPISVRITEDGSTFKTPEKQGRAKVELINHDHTTPVTTSAYTQLVASTSGDINRFHIFDSSGQVLVLATGAAAAEVDIAYIPSGGLDSPLDIYVASGTRLSVKAVTANTSTGNLIITALD